MNPDTALFGAVNRGSTAAGPQVENACGPATGEMDDAGFSRRSRAEGFRRVCFFWGVACATGRSARALRVAGGGTDARVARKGRSNFGVARCRATSFPASAIRFLLSAERQWPWLEPSLYAARSIAVSPRKRDSTSSLRHVALGRIRSSSPVCVMAEWQPSGTGPYNVAGRQKRSRARKIGRERHRHDFGRMRRESPERVRSRSRKSPDVRHKKTGLET